MKVLDEYQSYHKNPVNQAIHLVCIPLIIASLVLLFINPVVGAALFVAGWILQFVGHGVFEKKSPAFLKNLAHLLVGPLWWGVKIWGLVPRIARGPRGRMSADEQDRNHAGKR